MKLTKLLFVALLVLIVFSAGCVGFCRDSYHNFISTPVPPVTLQPTVTVTPLNQTIDRQYMYADKLNTALEYYNNGITSMNESKKAADRLDWTNATIDIQSAKANMEQARSEFAGMKQYAATPNEINLSAKWNETAYYYLLAFDYINQSYQENAYQDTRSSPNYIKLNYYIGQANYYIGLARNSMQEAIDLERQTFIGQQGQISS